MVVGSAVNLWERFLLWTVEYPRQADILLPLLMAMIIILPLVWLYARWEQNKGNDSQE
jgi:hypothetical protein